MSDPPRDARSSPAAPSVEGRAPEVSVVPLLDEAWAHLTAGEHGAARQAARTVLAAEPDHPEAHMVLGLAELGDGDRASAIEAFERASALDESYLAPRLYCAEALAAEPAQRGEALQRVEAAYALTEPRTPEHADVVLLHVSLLRLTGEAREARRRLLRLRPEALPEPDQCVHAARLALALGAAAFARDVVQSIEGPAAAGPDVLHLSAQLAEGDGEIERALGLYLRVLAADRDALPNRRLPTAAQVSARVRRAQAALSPEDRGVVADAEIRVRDLPPEELVADGLDPRMPLLLTGPPVPSPALGGRPRAYHLFVYRANLEPAYGLDLSMEALLERALREAVAHFSL